LLGLLCFTASFKPSTSTSSLISDMSIPLEEDVDFFTFEEYTPLAVANAESDATQNDLFQFAVLQFQEHPYTENILTTQDRGGFQYDFTTSTTAVNANYLDWIDPSPLEGVSELNITTSESASLSPETRIPWSAASSSSNGPNSIRNKFSDSALSESDLSVSC